MVDNPIRMTRRALELLPEYSTTIPTGTTAGRRWRRAIPFMRPHGVEPEEWWLGRYGKPYPPGHEYHGEIPIYWRRIIVQGDEPRWPRSVRVPPRRVAGLRDAVVGTDEGEQCLRRNGESLASVCLARPELRPDPDSNGCSCHRDGAPCGHCMSYAPECPGCGWRGEEPS